MTKREMQDELARRGVEFKAKQPDAYYRDLLDQEPAGPGPLPGLGGEPPATQTTPANGVLLAKGDEPGTVSIIPVGDTTPFETLSIVATALAELRRQVGL
jgi:hypothetical protein